MPGRGRGGGGPAGRWREPAGLDPLHRERESPRPVGRNQGKGLRGQRGTSGLGGEEGDGEGSLGRTEEIVRCLHPTEGMQV